MAEKKHNTNIATSEDFGDGLNMRTLADCTVRRLAFFESWLAYRGGQFISSHRVDETCLLLCVVNGRLLLAGFLTGPYTNLMVIENHLWNHIPHWEIKQDEYIRSPAYPLWLAAKYLHSRFHVELSSRFIVGDAIEISCCDERHGKEIDFELCYCRKDWCGIHALWNDDSVPKQDPPAAPEEIRRAVLGLRSFDMKTAEHWLKEALPGDFFHKKNLSVQTQKITDKQTTIYVVSEVSASINYKGKEYTKRAYPFGEMLVVGDKIPNENGLENHCKEIRASIPNMVWERIKKNTFLSIILMLLSIFVSAFIRSYLLVIPVFLASALFFAYSLLSDFKTEKLIHRQVNDECNNYAENHLARRKEKLE